MAQPGESKRATFEAPKDRRESVPGRLIIRVEPEAVRPHVTAPRLVMRAGESARLPKSVAEPIGYLRRNAGLRDVEPLFSTRRRQLHRVSPADRQLLAVGASVADVREDELAGLTVATLPEKKLTRALVKRIDSAPGVAFAEPLPARWLATPSVDPQRNLQWGLRAIRWFEAKLPNAAAVTVAVLDTGIDVRHPDLPEPSVYDHSGNGAPDLIGHGTHVAGIIAAKTNNAVGIAGVATCRLAVWKVFPDRPENGSFYLDTERFLQVLGSLPDTKTRVVNLSLGGPQRSRTEELLFARLAKAGITSVAAMGNEYEEGNRTSYPAAYSDVISVGSIAEDRRRSTFSNTGRHIDLVAPGSNILSTLPARRSAYRQETKYAAWSGTSMATPHVTAAAALLGAKNRNWTPQDIRDRLTNTAERLEAMAGRDRTSEYGAGLLDLKAALS